MLVRDRHDIVLDLSVQLTVPVDIGRVRMHLAKQLRLGPQLTESRRELRNAGRDVEVGNGV